MIKRPVRVFAVGVMFAAVGIAYGALSRDWGGTTMLLALGIATGIMAYVLISGSPRGDDAG